MAYQDVFSEYKLDNGLKIILKEDHRAPVVIFQIFYKVGSSFEIDGKTGISHALEHMMFRGTALHSSDYFLQTIAGFGGQQNAHTSHDYTTYYEIMPANKLSYCFKFEADRMHSLLLRSQDFAKEIKVVMEERRMMIEDDPERLALECFNAFAYITSPYRHPIIGWMKDIKNLTVHDLRRWYKTWYTPNNAVIVIVGDVKFAKVIRLAQQYFSKMTPSSIIPIPRSPERISNYGTRTTIIRTQTNIPRLIFGFDAPSVMTDAEDAYALLCLCHILAGGKSARLQKLLLQKKENATAIDFHYSPFHRLDTLLLLTAMPMSNHRLDEIKDDMLSAINELQQNKIKRNELERTKTDIIANRIYESDSIAHQAQEIGTFEMIGLTWKATNHAYEIIQKINADQIQTVAQKYLSSDHLMFASIEPKKSYCNTLPKQKQHKNKGKHGRAYQD